MPKITKSIPINKLHEDMSNFYRTKSITGNSYKRYLEETEKVIEYHLQQGSEILDTTILYNMTKMRFTEGILVMRGIFLSVLYFIVENYELNIDVYLNNAQILNFFSKQFIDRWSKTHSINALPTIKSVLTHFLLYLYFNDVYELRKIDIDLLKGYIEYMHKINKYNTVFDNITKLRKILEYAYEMNFISQDIVKYLYGMKTHGNEQLPDQYSMEEISQLINSVQHDNERGKRKYSILLMIVLLGIRSIDVSCLKINDIHWSESELKFKQSKTKSEIILSMPNILKTAVLDYLSVRADTNSMFLFTPLPKSNSKIKLTSYSISRIIHECFVSSKIVICNRKSYAHVLRHSLATSMINDGITLPVVSEILGHSSIDITKHYARISLDNLRKLVLEVPAYE